MCVCVYVCMSVCVRVCVYAHVRRCMCLYVRVQLYVYVYTHAYVYAVYVLHQRSHTLPRCPAGDEDYACASREIIFAMPYGGW